MADISQHCHACGRELADDMLERLINTDRTVALHDCSKVEIDQLDTFLRRTIRSELLLAWLNWHHAEHLKHVRVLLRERFDAEATPTPPDPMPVP